jgi:hypothetical protein
MMRKGIKTEEGGDQRKRKKRKKGKGRGRDGLSLGDGPPLRLVRRVVVLELEGGVVADGGDRDGSERASRHVGDVVDGDAAKRKNTIRSTSTERGTEEETHMQ